MRSVHEGSHRDGKSHGIEFAVILAGFVDLEQLSPEETVAMLSDYSEQMIAAIFKNFGPPTRFIDDEMEFTASADARNPGARLEQATRVRGVTRSYTIKTVP
jgi:hypothetical protein